MIIKWKIFGLNNIFLRFISLKTFEVKVMLQFNLVSNGKSLPASFAFQATEWIRRRSADAKIITHFKRSCNNVAINS